MPPRADPAREPASNRGSRATGRRVASTLAALAALASAGPGAAAPGPAAPPAAAPFDPTGLAPRLRALLEDAGVPAAAAALVSRDGEPWFFTYGARAPGGDPVTPRSLFRVGSISKAVLALGLVRRAAAGRLGLDDEVATLAPELAIDNPFQPTAPLRVAHLLEHTAGLPDMGFCEVLRDPGSPGRPPLETLRDAPGELRCRWPPGSRFAYSNRGFEVAAHVLEKSSGKPWRAAVRDEVLAPLGLGGSGYDLADGRGDRLVAGYTDREAPPVTYRPAHFAPAANWMASAADLARLTRFFLRRGDGLVEPRLIARVERPATSAAARAGLATGWGLGNFSRVNRSRVTWGHYGGGYAYQATFRYLPSAGVGWVLLFACSDRRAAFGAVQDELYSRLRLPRARPAPAGISADLAAELAGWYRPENPRYEPLAAFECLLGSGRLLRVGPRLEWRPLRPGGRVREVVSWGTARGAAGPTAVVGFTGESGPGLAVLREDGAEPLLAGGTKFLRRQAWPGPPVELTALVLALLAALVTPLAAWARGGAGWRRVGVGVASAALATGLAAASRLAVHQLGRVSLPGAALFGASAVYPLAVIALALRPPAGWSARAGVAAHLFLAAWLARAGLVGVKVW